MNDTQTLLEAESDAASADEAKPRVCSPDQRETPLPSPAKIRRDLPLSERGQMVVRSARASAERILRGEDRERLLVVCGPCSISDLNSATVYAQKLARLADSVSDRIQIIMRVYLEKPRSVVGWKGLLHDPLQDGPQSASSGITVARRLLLRLADNGVACATEFLSPAVALYLEDAMAYGSIGSRTAESQIHRELASQLDLPMGMKNAMDGDPSSAVNAVKAATQPHSVFGMNLHGQPCLIETRGNELAHVILRGGASGPNYDQASIAKAVAGLRGASPLQRPVVVDCSHGNSRKDHRNQSRVAREVVGQFLSGQTGIAGIMLESNLVEGRQDAEDGKPLRFGQSITDACIGWEETESLVLEIAETLRSGA